MEKIIREIQTKNTNVYFYKLDFIEETLGYKQTPRTKKMLIPIMHKMGKIITMSTNDSSFKKNYFVLKMV